jgi:hypothetical protein
MAAAVAQTNGSGATAVPLSRYKSDNRHMKSIVATERP